MARLQMQRVYLCALKRDRKAILESLQRLEMMEIRDFDETQEDGLHREEEILQKREVAKKNMENADAAMQIIKKLAKEKIKEPFFLQGRKELHENQYNRYVHEGYAQDEEMAMSIVDKNKIIREKRSEISQLTAKLESLEPWENLDVPLDFKGTDKTSFFIGTIPEQLSKLMIEDKITDKLIANDVNVKEVPFEIEVISSIDVLTYFTLICLKKDQEVLYEALRMSGFVPPVIEGDKKVEELKRESLEKIQELKNQVLNLEKDILKNVNKIENLRFLSDYETFRMENIDALSKLHESNKTFILKGYVPKKCASTLREKLESKYIIEIQFEDTQQYDEDVPVLLENNPYSAPIEGVIESYSLPYKNEVDPTFVVSLFYYFMFGLMLSDAGYGFIIFAFSAIGLFKFRKTLEENWKKTLRMYLFCGAFTIFWGIMFGSYFGDIVDVTSSTFFGKTISIEPVWYLPVKDPMRLLTFSLIIGVVHLFVGMFLKALQYSRIKDYASMFKEVILWYGLLIGCLIILLSTEMLRGIFNYDFLVPQPILLLGKVLAAASAIAIILTNGSSKNIAVKIAQGLYSLYGISGYLSDVLSYSRLLALGLATGVIASVINMMAGMVAEGAGGFIGAIIFIVIMVFGHLFNLAINALGAYVHTNRLQYVELFGKFYDGGGLKFNPLKMNTKYFKFKESK